MSGGAELRQLKREFDSADPEGNGYIGPKQLRDICLKRGVIRPTEADVRAMLKQMDANNDGQVSFREFCAFHHRFADPAKAAQLTPFIRDSLASRMAAGRPFTAPVMGSSLLPSAPGQSLADDFPFFQSSAPPQHANRMLPAQVDQRLESTQRAPSVSDAPTTTTSTGAQASHTATSHLAWRPHSAAPRLNNSSSLPHASLHQLGRTESKEDLKLRVAEASDNARMVASPHWGSVTQGGAPLPSRGSPVAQRRGVSLPQARGIGESHHASGGRRRISQSPQAPHRDPFPRGPQLAAGTSFDERDEELLDPALSSGSEEDDGASGEEGGPAVSSSDGSDDSDGPAVDSSGGDDSDVADTPEVGTTQQRLHATGAVAHTQSGHRSERARIHVSGGANPTFRGAPASRSTQAPAWL
eukprot:INCI12312.1.p1 GENE.INCI12312.1~~INCI12312.1.p1  ORF type:complete len:413 (+),score=63.06 INCI12312.1:409-1647(+)